jgi:hypothetical protein
MAINTSNIWDIIEYRIINLEQETSHNSTNIIKLTIEYSLVHYRSRYLINENFNIIFKFTESEKLYKMITKVPTGLMKFLIKDNVIIIKDSVYFLSKSTLIKAL